MYFDTSTATARNILRDGAVRALNNNPTEDDLRVVVDICRAISQTLGYPFNNTLNEVRKARTTRTTLKKIRRR